MISIVIPLYNKEQSIGKTLNSVYNQTFTDYELIIVNDGSTDKSVDIVKSWIQKHSMNEDKAVLSSYRIVNKDNGGVCSARNLGIKESKGEYVAFLDADDLWDSGYLQEQVFMIADYPDCDMWSMNFIRTGQSEIQRPDSTGLPVGFRGVVDNYFTINNRVSDLCHSSSVVIRKSVFDIVGLFDERIKYAEDDDMWWRIIAYSSLAFNDKVMVFYRQDAENRALSRKQELRYSLPFYVDKYRDALFQNNAVFYYWINRWCAVKIKHVYFGDSIQRKDARIAIGKLDMSVLPKKYKLLFGLPFPLAKVMYILYELRMNMLKDKYV